MKPYTRGEKILPRYGHTSLFFDRQLIIYGGATEWDSTADPSREDLLIYNIGRNFLN